MAEARPADIPIAAIRDMLRPQDLADVDIILSAEHRLDLVRIRKTLTEFAETLERPEIVEHFESLLARHKLSQER